MKFNIIENSEPGYLEKYDEFIRLYQDNTRKKDILRILDLTENQYRHTLKKGVEDGLIVKRNRGRKKQEKNRARNYCFNSCTGYWQVYKAIDGKLVNGSCKSEDECIRLVEYLNKNGWSKKNIRIFKGL